MVVLWRPWAGVASRCRRVVGYRERRVSCAGGAGGVGVGVGDGGVTLVSF